MHILNLEADFGLNHFWATLAGGILFCCPLAKNKRKTDCSLAQNFHSVNLSVLSKFNEFRGAQEAKPTCYVRALVWGLRLYEVLVCLGS